MKSAKIYQEQLITGLSTVNRAISSHVVLAILSNILLTFTEKNLTLFATDLEMGIETVVPCEQSEPFTTTIPAKIFNDLIATMPGQLIELQYNEDTDTMTVKGSKSVHNIKCIPPVDYPKPLGKIPKELFSLDTTNFKATVSRILFAASEEDNKPVLNSVVFSVEDEQIVIYATDGFRASLRKLLVPTAKLEASKIIIPSIIVSEAAKVFTGDAVAFSFTSNLAIFKCGKTKVYGQIVDGKAPDHLLIQQMIDSITQSTINLSVTDFGLLCKQADIFVSKDEKKFLHLSIDLTGMTVTGSAQQIGDSTGRINGLVTGAPIEISVSSTFLREFLDAAKTPSIKMCMKDSRSPIVIYLDELPGYWHMIMPVAG